MFKSFWKYHLFILAAFLLLVPCYAFADDGVSGGGFGGHFYSGGGSGGGGITNDPNAGEYDYTEGRWYTRIYSDDYNIWLKICDMETAQSWYSTAAEARGLNDNSMSTPRFFASGNDSTYTRYSYDNGFSSPLVGSASDLIAIVNASTENLVFNGSDVVIAHASGYSTRYLYTHNGNDYAASYGNSIYFDATKDVYFIAQASTSYSMAVYVYENGSRVNVGTINNRGVFYPNSTGEDYGFHGSEPEFYPSYPEPIGPDPGPGWNDWGNWTYDPDSGAISYHVDDYYGESILDTLSYYLPRIRNNTSILQIIYDKLSEIKLGVDGILGLFAVQTLGDWLDRFLGDGLTPFMNGLEGLSDSLQDVFPFSLLADLTGNAALFVGSAVMPSLSFNIDFFGNSYPVSWSLSDAGALIGVDNFSGIIFLIRALALCAFVFLLVHLTRKMLF